MYQSPVATFIGYCYIYHNGRSFMFHFFLAVVLNHQPFRREGCLWPTEIENSGRNIELKQNKNKTTARYLQGNLTKAGN